MSVDLLHANLHPTAHNTSIDTREAWKAEESARTTAGMSLQLLQHSKWHMLVILQRH